MMDKRVVIGCGIFEDEMTEALKGETRFDVELYWLPSGYHARTDWLAEKLTEAILGRNLADSRELRVLYGASCLLDVEESLKKRLKILPSDNCLTAMVGRQRLREIGRAHV
jgi:hypothetical protein